MRILNTVGIKVSFKPLKTLKNIIKNPKDPTKPDEKFGIVYEIPCANCNHVYIGQTQRSLQSRLKEHKRYLKKHDSHNSALVTHVEHFDHKININNATIITQEQDWTKRCFLESWHINERSDVMNRSDGTLMSSIYKSLLNKHS